MRKLLVAAALVAIATPMARADVPKPDDGAQEMQITEGETKSIAAPNGAQVVCDDPAVVRSDIQDEKFVLIGVHVGSTLCGVRFAGLPRGLYKVTVVAPVAPVAPEKIDLHKVTIPPAEK